MVSDDPASMRARLRCPKTRTDKIGQIDDNVSRPKPLLALVLVAFALAFSCTDTATTTRTDTRQHAIAALTTKKARLTVKK